jgi:nucleotide sugar dehydrogenase
MTRRIAVVGSGYVGTVVAACFAHLGHDVVGLEVDAGKLVSLRNGAAPFHEAGLDDLITRGISGGRLRFTESYPDAMESSDIVFICVGTPPRPDGSADMSHVEMAAHSMAATTRHHHILVNKSTVPIGTAAWLTSILEREAGMGSFSVVSNPEFLREGDAVHDFLYPERVIMGSYEARALDVLADLYQPILSRSLPDACGVHRPVPLIRTTPATAEMAKYASNAFLATKVSFINEIARLCELVGADVTEVAEAMGLDSRIGGQFLGAGLGWGGSCFGKDVAALIGTAGNHWHHARILEAALAVNNDQRQFVVDHLLEHLGDLSDARVGVLGLAFKPGTDDVRDSPAVEVCKRLLDAGASVVAYDPLVGSVPQLPSLRVAGATYEVAESADAVVVATDWPQFLDIDLRRLRLAMRGSLFFDGRNSFDIDKVTSAGLRYVGVGRPPTRQDEDGVGPPRRAIELIDEVAPGPESNGCVPEDQF